MPGPSRRALFTALPVALPLALAAAPARAYYTAAPDVVLYTTQETLEAGQALGRAFTAAHDVPVRVFGGSAQGQLALIALVARCDLILAPVATLDPAKRRGAWRNLVVIAGREGTAVQELSPAALGAALGDGALALPDPTELAAFDARAVLGDAMPARTIGGATGADAAFLVASGAARLGVMMEADRVAAGLQTVFSTAAAPLVYAMAPGANAASRYWPAFLDFAAGPEAAPIMRKAGLRA
jgi:hypothetical protein